LVSPSTDHRTVAIRKPNTELRSREYLKDEVAKLMKAPSGNRWGQRDTTMVLVASSRT
jgi:type 1 fimbriae regulatory protein FimB/type 1 fimbriae regulatory protein FimE